MRKILTSVLMIIIISGTYAQSIGIGTTTPDSKAVLDITSTTKGLLIPRMTETQKNAIASPTQGLILFNVTANSFQYYNGTAWNNIAHSGIISGTNNRIPRFTGPWGLGNGMMTDNGIGVAINTTGNNPDGSAALDINSSDKGLLIPRLLTSQRLRITSPAKGLLVFDNDTNSFWFNNGTAWIEIAASNGSGFWKENGANIYNNNTNNVGIGTSAPSARLEVTGIDATSANNALTLKDSKGKSLLVMRNDGRMGIAYNGQTFGRTLNIGGTGVNFHDVNSVYGGSVFATDTTLVIWSDNTNNQKLVIQPEWGNTGIGTYNPTSKLHVNGDVRIDGKLNPGSTLIIGNNAAIAGALTVNNGKGVAYNSNSATNLKIYPFTTSVFTAVLPGFGLSGESAIGFNGGFTGTPRVLVGDINTIGGSAGQLYRVQLILYGCQTSNGLSSCKARLLNTSPNPVNYSITWNCVAIGN